MQVKYSKPVLEVMDLKAVDILMTSVEQPVQKALFDGLSVGSGSYISFS